MLEKRISRRRALCIIAGTAAMLVPVTPRAASVEWHGHALGADARMLFLGADQRDAGDAVQACTEEIERLERIFSLYRNDSELVRLNAQGFLLHPSLDLLNLLRQSKELSQATGSLFDPTVQPLWQQFADWYAGQPDRASLPSDRLAKALELVGMDRVAIGEDRICLAEGTRLTLNGIAQGYITSRVGGLLRRRGWSHVLVDLGEVAALGPRPDGGPFDIAIRDRVMRIPLDNTALATSAANGLMFSARHGHGHLINPRTAATSVHWQSVTVRNPDATIADGLSTALALASPAEINAILRCFPDTDVWAVRANGQVAVFSS